MQSPYSDCQQECKVGQSAFLHEQEEVEARLGLEKRRLRVAYVEGILHIPL